MLMGQLLQIFYAMRFFVACFFMSIVAGSIVVARPFGLADWTYARVNTLWGEISLKILGIKLNIDGEHHIQEPAIFVLNHQSMVDLMIVTALLPDKTRYVAKKELEKIPIFGWALAPVGIMIDRKRPRDAMNIISAQLEKLDGWSVAIFPEGTRTRDGELRPFKKGAFYMALQTKLPLIPVAFDGAFQSVSKGGFFPKPTRIYVNIGPPINTENWVLEDLNKHVESARQALLDCFEKSRGQRIEDEA